ncbi:MAG: magnesium transporter CorA family protein [Bacilli bacterium]
MISIYKTDSLTTKTTKIEKIEPGCWIDLKNPTPLEVEKISKELLIDCSFINYVLDDDEQPRIDIEEDKKLIILDVPIKISKRNYTVIDTVPLGLLIVRDEYLVTISLSELDIIEDLKNEKVKDFYTYKKSRFTIQVLFRVATLYLKYLKNINIEIEKAEEELFKATKNKELVRLLTLEKSLVYITTSLKSNLVVLEKIYKGTIIETFDEDNHLLEDAIIENKQGIEMANLYREILGSMTDSFATIISNNLNTVMKFLTAITIVISVPTMVASFLGMNVPMGIVGEHPLSFLLVSVLSILLSIVVIVLLKKKDMF